MGRRRKSDRHLPERVYFKHNAYYRVDESNKWRRLGKTQAEMYAALAMMDLDGCNGNHCRDAGDCRSIDDLCDYYAREVLISYSQKEQKNRAPHIRRIRAVFGGMRPADVKPQHVAAFRDKVGVRTGKSWEKPELARKALSVLSHIYGFALEWGLADRNPCADVKRPPRTRRLRYPTDAEFRAVRDYCPPMIQAAMDIALLTGLRRGDILALTRESVTDEGLRVETSKTEVPLVFAMSPALEAAIRAALALPPQIRRYIICTRHGKQFSGEGFASAWDRGVKKAMENGVLKEPFRFHDIRAKSASDDSNTDRASQRLGHKSRITTERHYLRTAKKVEPLR